MQCLWLCALPLEVLHENILIHLSVRDLQAINTAFTNKLDRLKLREVWKSYRWLRMDYAVALDDLCWLHIVGVQVVGIRTWFAWRVQDVQYVVTSTSTWFPLLRQLHHDLICGVTDEILVELAHSCPLLEVLRLRYGDYSDIGITALAQHCHQLHTISLYSDNITNTGIQALCDNCPHLRNIDVSPCRKLTNASLIGIANSFPHLQSIQTFNFTDDALIFFANKCHELRSVRVSFDNNITSRGLTALWAANTYLTDVELSGEDRSDDDVDSLLKNCHALINISFKWCYNISDAAVISVADHCPQLKSLNICGCRDISDASLVALGQHCHELKSIDIAFLRKITDVGISALAAGCPLLQVLNGALGNITDIAVRELAKGCSELCKIDLNSCQSISIDAVAAIAENCPLLSVLDISFCHNLHSDCLYTIAQHCRNLTKLNFMNNNDLEAEALLTLIVSCKQLRDLRCGERYLDALRCYSTSVFVH